MRFPELPLSPFLDEIRRHLRDASFLVLEAPPGTGKTTLLPLALLDEPWLAQKKILLLQPRRLAARSVAERMSQTLNEPLGATVGYRVRGEASVSAKTRIEVITEALLLRRLQDDPELPGIGAVLFDEFHERSLFADLGLALALDVLDTVRPDLRLVVMSATLGDADFKRLSPGATTIRIPATAFPVELRYTDTPRADIDRRSAEEAAKLLAETAGGVLVFLPGLRHIRDALSRFAELPIASSVEALALSGEMPLGEQARAVLPSHGGRRKVIFATPVAETSITVEGITGVVDSGLAKVDRFEPGSGMSRLVTERIAADSAEQRRGRAGRTQPGICVRLWGEAQQNRLPRLRAPELEISDLCQLVLEASVWSDAGVSGLRLLSSPPAAALEEAERVLRLVGATDDAGAITPRGKMIAALGCHPRLAALAIEARSAGLETLGARLVAILEDRDPLGRSATADLAARIRLFESGRRSELPYRLSQSATMWEQRIRALPRQTVASWPSSSETATGVLLARAFPERIAKRRAEGQGRYLLASGTGAVLPEHDGLRASELLAVATLHQRSGEPFIRLAAALGVEHFDEHRGALAHLAELRPRVEFDERTGAIAAVEERRAGAIVFSERRIEAPDEMVIRDAALDALRRAGGISALEWTPAARGLRARADAVRASVPEAEIPDVSDSALNEELSTLSPADARHLRRRATWSELSVEQLLRTRLGWRALRALEEHAPESIELPGGRIRAITFAADGGPVLEATVQELFGWKETPRLASGRLALTIHILSPARRPVQVTRDLEGFWRATYPEVRKELRGRYPKHAWPESGHDAPAGIQREKKK